MPTHTGRHFLPKAMRLDCKKSCQVSGWKALGSPNIRFQKAPMPAPNFSRPMPVLIIDCKCEKRRQSLPAPDNAFRELMTSGATCESNSSSGHQLGHSLPPVPWSLLPSPPLPTRKRKHGLLPGIWNSPAPMSLRRRGRAVPREDCVLPLTPRQSGDMLTMLSRAWPRLWLRRLGRCTVSMLGWCTPSTTGE